LLLLLLPFKLATCHQRLPAPPIQPTDSLRTLEIILYAIIDNIIIVFIYVL